MKLTREIRCSPDDGGAGEIVNPWAGASGDGFERFWVLRMTVEGAIDAQTGYVCDIKRLDRILRETTLPALKVAMPSGTRVGDATGSTILAVAGAFDISAWQCPTELQLFSIELATSPFMRFSTSSGDAMMVEVTRSFDFCAAHRLAGEGLTAEENRRVFGKCSNPHGHGHNYTVAVTVRGGVDEKSGTIIDLPLLDRVVMEEVVERFDHKNLNEECPEFRGVNPTVENIAQVIFRRLALALRPVQLARVRVWETAKTYAECNGVDG